MGTMQSVVGLGKRSFPFGHYMSVVGCRSSFPISAGCGPLLRGIEPLAVMLAQDGLAECDQLGTNPYRQCTTGGIWAGATKRTDSKIHSFYYCHEIGLPDRRGSETTVGPILGALVNKESILERVFPITRMPRRHSDSIPEFFKH